MTTEPPLGWSTTAEQIVVGHDLSSKIVLITGATSGLGKQAAQALASCGAHLIIAARNIERGQAAGEDIVSMAGSGTFEVHTLDLASQTSIRSFAERVLASHTAIDVLINCAGVMAVSQSKTADGIEVQLATNHLGPFLLTNLLLPALTAAKAPRIVTLASVGHRRTDFNFDDPQFEHSNYDKWLAYGQSKTANILFNTGLTRRVAPAGIACFAVHPGDVLTNIARNLTQQEIDDFLIYVDEADDPHLRMKTPEQGAATICYATVSRELKGLSGLYLENCSVASIDDESEWSGVRTYALDHEKADRLWALSEQMVGQSFDF